MKKILNYMPGLLYGNEETDTMSGIAIVSVDKVSEAILYLAKKRARIINTSISSSINGHHDISISYKTGGTNRETI